MNLINKLFKRTRIAVILTGAALLALGVVLCVRPVGAFRLLMSLTGWVLVIVGVVTLANFWRHRLDATGRADLVTGVLELFFGILFVLLPETFVGLFYALLGVVILVTGVNDVTEALAMSSLGLPGTGWRIALAVLTLLSGLLVIASPFAMAEVMGIVAGVTLVFDGVSEIVAGVQMRRTD